MSDFVKPISTEINAPILVGSASTVSDAKVVRAVNTNAAAQLVTVVDTNGATVGTMSIPASGISYIPKAKTDKIFAASADVKLASVTWPRG